MNIQDPERHTRYKTSLCLHEVLLVALSSFAGYLLLVSTDLTRHDAPLLTSVPKQISRHIGSCPYRGKLPLLSRPPTAAACTASPKHELSSSSSWCLHGRTQPLILRPVHPLERLRRGVREWAHQARRRTCVLSSPRSPT